MQAGAVGPLVHAVLDLDAVSPNEVPAGDYLEKVLLELHQRGSETGARRAVAVRELVDEAKVTLALNLCGWDRLAWLPLAIELELPVGGLRDLFFRYWTPDQARPAPERFLETLRELAAEVAERHGGGRLLLQIPEQRQLEASMRDLLLQWLQSLPGLVLAFTQHDAGRESDDQDLAPLRLALQPLTAADLDQWLAGCLGGRNIAFDIVADCLSLDKGRRDRLLNLLDAHLVEPQADPASADAPEPEPQLDYLGCRHLGFPDQEVFRNPLLAQHLRNRQRRSWPGLLPCCRRTAPGRAQPAHVRSAGRELVADLKARRVSPEVVWGAIKQNQDRWHV